MLAKPAIRKFAHGARLRELGFEGAKVVRRLGFDGLRVERERWSAAVEFRPSFEQGGHTHFKADLRRPTPDVEFRPEEGGARALVPKGDEAAAEKLMTPGLRDVLLRLGAKGGRLWYVRGGAMEIAGPLPGDARELRAFLELCAEAAERAVEALSS